MGSTFLLCALLAGASAFAGIAVGFVIGRNVGHRQAVREFKALPSPVMPAFLFASAGLMAVLALGATGYSAWFLATSVPTLGTVVEMREQQDDKGRKHAYPVYRYTDTAGHEHVEISTGNDGRKLQAGDAVAVRYLKGSPQRSRIDRPMFHWGLPIALGIMAAGLAVGGCISRWNYRRRIRTGARDKTD